MDTILLHTKSLVPLIAQTLTPRTRLLHRLTEGIENRMSLLSAPTGYGKTVLLTQWIPTLASDGWRIAWLSLDEKDNDPFLFWNYIFKSINICAPGISEAALTLLTGQPNLSWEPVLTTLINSLSHQEQRILLILDNYHHIHEPSLHASLIFLLEYLPSQLRLVLSTRADPPFPLAQLRAQGQLQEIRTEQLRCTTDETIHFLTQVMRLSLSQDEMQRFGDRTEGWFVGLKLAAPSLHQHVAPVPILASLQGNQRYMLDYLINEVFLRLRPQLQQFLLGTSILEEMCGSLCNAVVACADSQSFLEEAERVNLFICALDAQREWYRYHQLFAEVLRYQLQRNHPPQTIHEFHLRASRWYQDHGRPEYALRHVLAAQKWDVAAQLIQPQLLLDVWTDYLLMQWMKRLPEDRIQPHPSLSVSYARSLYHADQQQVLHWIQQAEQFLRKDIEEDEEKHDTAHAQEWREQRNILGEVLGLRITVEHAQHEWSKTLTSCTEALSFINPNNIKGHATILHIRARAYAMKGDFAQTTTTALEAATLFHTIGDTPLELLSLGIAAYSCHYTGHLHQAQHIIEQALLLTDGQTQPTGTIYAIYSMQGYLDWHRHRLEQAHEWFTRAYTVASKAKLITYLDIIYANLARVSLSQGEVQQAEEFLRQARHTVHERNFGEGRGDAHYLLFTIPEQVRLLIAQGKSDHATITHQVDKNTHGLIWTFEEIAIARLLLAQSQAEEALVRLTPPRNRTTEARQWRSSY